jgi:DNA (cytosine-5)-methyltransferase 1
LTTTKAEPRAYYNEIDPYAAQWLRNLIAAGHIAPGDVDERSIEDVRPDDLRGYTQCHFFAGIAVWSYALRRAGFPDDRPVWTGSCPCQPFSAAGKGAGFADERHLWPAWFHLIEQCRPPVIFGEQVASPDGYAWLDLVQTDVEAAGYAFGPVVLPAAGFGAPHGRHRIYFVADADNPRLERWSGMPERAHQRAIGAYGVAGELDNTNGERRERQHALLGAEATGRNAGEVSQAAGTGEPSKLAHTKELRREGQHVRKAGELPQIGTANNCDTNHRRGPVNGFWRDSDWLLCRDDKWRPVEPGAFPLVDGATARVGRLRAYGNAIVAEVAREFIGAYLNINQPDLNGQTCESKLG